MKSIKAKKRFGQNFLKDESILEKIVQSMPNNNNKIVEIGPGLGDLTSRLLKQKDVRAYEVDRDLCPILEDKFKLEIDKKRFSLVCSDVLDYWDIHKSLEDAEYDLVANLPYYISTSIILKAFEDSKCANIMVMTQLEVAKKFAAKSGDSEFSSLSVLAEISGDAKILFKVPPTSFEPIPKVTSAIVLIKKHKDIVIEEKFKSFLKLAFSQPRKKLIKNLSSKYNKKILENQFKILNIDFLIRPHEMTTSLLLSLYTKI